MKYIKECFYDICDCIFESDKIGYELCPKCGSETMPNEVKLLIDKRVKAITNKYAKEAEHSASYFHYFNCPFASQCVPLGHYQPSCSNRFFRHECLLPLQNKQDSFEHRFDEILDVLNQINQKLQ